MYPVTSTAMSAPATAMAGAPAPYPTATAGGAGGVYPGYPAATGGMVGMGGAGGGAGAAVGGVGGGGAMAAQAAAAAAETAAANDQIWKAEAVRLPPMELEEQKCAGCGKAFGFMMRKHSCRCCGHKYCTTCCTEEIALPIPDYRNAPQHTCQWCVQHHRRGNQFCASRYLVQLMLKHAHPVPASKLRVALQGFTELATNAAAAASSGGSEMYQMPDALLLAVNKHGGLATLVAALERLSERQANDVLLQAARTTAALASMVIISSTDTNTFLHLCRPKLVPNLNSMLSAASAPGMTAAACDALSALCAPDNISFRSEVGALVVPRLCALLTSAGGVQVHAVRCLDAVMSSSVENKRVVRGVGGEKALVMLLEAPATVGADDLATAACEALATLLRQTAGGDPAEVVTETTANRAAVIAAGGVRAFAKLLAPSSLPNVRRNAIRCLRLLCASSEGATAFLEVNAMPAVAEMVTAEGEPSTQEEGMSLMMNVVSGSASGRHAFVAGRGLAAVASALFQASSADSVRGNAAAIVTELVTNWPTGADAPDLDHPMQDAGIMAALMVLLQAPSAELQTRALAAVSALINRSGVHRVDFIQNSGLQTLADFVNAATNTQLLQSAAVIVSAVLQDTQGLRSVRAHGKTRETVAKLAATLVGATEAFIQQHVLLALAALCGDPVRDAASVERVVAQEVAVLTSQCCSLVLEQPNTLQTVSNLLGSGAQLGVKVAALRLATAMVGPLESAADQLARLHAVPATVRLAQEVRDPEVTLLALGFFTRCWNFLGGPSASQGTRQTHAAANRAAIQGVVACAVSGRDDMRVLFSVAQFLKAASADPSNATVVASAAPPLLESLLKADLPTQYVE